METTADVKRASTRKILLWISIGSMVMLFAGLTSGYIVRQAEGNWTKFDLPKVFYISTAIILASSVFMNMAVNAIKNSNNKKATLLLSIALILGLGFMASQYLGWVKLVDMGVYLVGNPSGSFLYVITGLHLVHLIGGIIALATTTVRASNNKYTPTSYLGLQLCAIYWHFLDGLWVYLFLFLLLMR